MQATGYAAIVLAGGRARRLGGAPKPVLAVGGTPMIDRVLAAVADAATRIVVGPPMPLPAGVHRTAEDPPGGGPAAAAAAGLALVDTATVALLAADLPLLTPDAVATLLATLDEAPTGTDGVVYVDDTGRRQLLCGVWRTAGLRSALAGPDLAGASLTRVLAGRTIADLRSTHHPPPWYDCDTPEELTRAEEWTT